MRKGFIVCITLLLMAVSISVAQETSCRRCTAKLTAEAKKFAVIIPKCANMESSSFDDIGCALQWRNAECAMRQSLFDENARAYDYGTGEEFPMEKLFYAVGTGIKTPKGYGVVAFKEKADAEKFVTQAGKGKVLKLFELVDEPLKN
jgi:nitrous oxide reductase accessory protein NosL